MVGQLDGFIIDLDGTVYKGNSVIEGAKETIDLLKSQGKRVVFLSNRGNVSRVMCQKKLISMGIDVELDEILLTSTVMAQYIRTAYPLSKIWVLGDSGLRDELISWGVELATVPEAADWLVVTLHENLTYAELNQAFRAVRNGAGIMATNADKSFPGDDGESIDVAGMVGAIVAATGKEVDIVIGKPSAYMANAALRALQLPAEQCVIIGDSLASDIRMGKQFGMKTALVLSGSTTRKVAEAAEDRPDWIWESLSGATEDFTRKEAAV
jgi:arabinose operon protein AraL